MELSKEGLRTLIFQGDPYEFEELTAELLEKWGWESAVTAGSNDQGIDILVNKSEPFPQKYAIQVKQNSMGNKVGSPEIQQYSSILNQNESIDGVVVITTSSFTSHALEIGADLGVKLIDGDDLIELFNHSDGEKVLNSFFDLGSEQSTESTKSNRWKSPESSEEIVFKTICRQYGRSLSGPTELDTQSCPICSGTIYSGKIMYMGESTKIKFCLYCETVFIEKENGWKTKSIDP